MSFYGRFPHIKLYYHSEQSRLFILLKYVTLKNILLERELNNITILYLLVSSYCALVKVGPFVP
jgi:hypothetical protein